MLIFKEFSIRFKANPYGICGADSFAGAISLLLVQLSPVYIISTALKTLSFIYQPPYTVLFI
jgi:hypothetical protein